MFLAKVSAIKLTLKRHCHFIKGRIGSFCSFLRQCYKDLGQRNEARKMCAAACSMNVVSKEVDLVTVLLPRCIYIHLTGMSRFIKCIRNLCTSNSKVIDFI